MLKSSSCRKAKDAQQNIENLYGEIMLHIIIIIIIFSLTITPKKKKKNV